MYNHTKEYTYYLNDVEAMIIKIVSIVGWLKILVDVVNG